ncbi:MAG: TRAP transporter substrate-binding protein [Paracoccaceae bacterium]|nr:MAG: TRAP transporter substrate-binding protein [Paracoccaceae bacterium]
MTMKRRTALGFGLAIALGTLAGMPAAAQEVTLKMAYFLPAQAPVPTRVLNVWAQNVESQSGGRIKIEQYPAMQLGGRPADLIDQVTDGVADIVWTLPGYTPGRFPQSEVFELPFLMTDAESHARAMWELGESRFFAGEFKDVKVIGLFCHGPGLIHSKTPIVTTADLRGVKLRAPTRVTNKMVETLGATAVGMPVPAVAESLSKGVIDATIIPWEVTGAVKSSELVKNHTEFPGAPLYTSVFLMAMNKDVYDRLPDDLKAVIDANSGAEFSAFAARESQAADEPARAATLAMGNNIIELTPDQIAEWKAAAQPTVEAWVAEITATGVDGAALLAEAQAAIARHAK